MANQNKILTTLNQPLNVEVYSLVKPDGDPQTYSTLDGIPLGTDNNAEDGELGLKVIIIADRTSAAVAAGGIATEDAPTYLEGNTEALSLDLNGNLRVAISAPVQLDAGDIEIGAVELKDGSTNVRANIDAANTARTTATPVLSVQVIKADGTVLSDTPAGGATAANQATQITAEQAILAKIVTAPALASLQPAVTPSLNSGVMDAGTQRVVLASDGPTVTALGTTTQTKATDGTATAWSMIQLLKGIFDKLLNTLGVTQSGTWTVGLSASQTLATVTSVTAITNALPAGTNALGTVKTTPATSATLANVASSASNVTLQASNANRRGLMIFNDSTAILYVKFGATATSSSYTVQMAAGAYYEFPSPIYTGIVDGIWASANGNARMTEIA